MRHGSYNPVSARRSLIRRGFTLIEILIVVIILGILASIVVPQFAKATGDSSNATFVHDIKLLARLIVVQQHQHGHWPADQLPGIFPPEMAGKIDPGDWSKATPIGGNWDYDAGVYGVLAGVSVELPDRTPAQMIEIDRMIDDGNLTTGAFRQRTNAYIYVLAE
ncbi:MAG TPA: prepilin-type N-terminal cleavage/methylation domain-containing protein [Fimbriimonas sp.]|nr:prepilin-type N-terminal cleavage/methylation domain-containing protein [Fimbriimonas sp.]